MTPARMRATTTRRGIPHSKLESDDELPTNEIEALAQTPEPAASGRATRRDLAVRDFTQLRTDGPPSKPRGEYSIPTVRGIPSDVVSGSIVVTEVSAPKKATRRAAATTPRPAGIRLANVTRSQITVVIDGETVTLDRQNAVALAQLIMTAFG